MEAFVVNYCYTFVRMETSNYSYAYQNLVVTLLGYEVLSNMEHLDHNGALGVHGACDKGTYHLRK